jgi:hypothetical protein
MTIATAAQPRMGASQRACLGQNASGASSAACETPSAGARGGASGAGSIPGSGSVCESTFLESTRFDPATGEDTSSLVVTRCASLSARRLLGQPGARTAPAQ